MKNANFLPLEKKVAETVENFRMLDGHPRPKVLVALSGGADSVALLRAIVRLGDKLCNGIACAHVNHMIRGEEADRDELFVSQLCTKLGVALYTAKIDIPMLSKKLGTGVEETARNERYAFFDGICKQHGFDLIATAHTASDNAETMIFNLARGSCLDGLCGIPPVRDNIIRPLILCTRDEVEAYLSELGQEFVTDSTNLSDDYSRNLIRHAVIPQLKKINPSLEATLCETVQALRHDSAFLNDVANGKASGIVAEKEGVVANELVFKAPAVAARALREAYRKCFEKEIPGRNLKEIMRVSGEFFKEPSKDGISEKLVSVGKNEFALINFDGVRFLKKKIESKCNDFDYFLKSGENIICGTDYLVLVGKEFEIGFQNTFTSETQNSYKMLLNYSLFSDRILGNIKVRNRRDGDSYAFGGMTRKLKKVLCDKKIPIDQRDTLPIICDDNGIIFTAATPLADKHRGDGQSKGDLPIAIYKLIR